MNRPLTLVAERPLLAVLSLCALVVALQGRTFAGGVLVGLTVAFWISELLNQRARGRRVVVEQGLEFRGSDGDAVATVSRSLAVQERRR